MEIKIDEIVKQVLAEIGSAAEPAKAFVREEPSFTGNETGKAAVLVQPEMYEIKDFKIPEINEKEILVRMEGCMISGVDTAEFLRSRRIGMPEAAGQEGTGVIVKLGSDSLKDAAGNTLRVGDRVITVKKSGLSGAAYYGTAKRDTQGNSWFSDYAVFPAGQAVYQVNGLDLESRLLMEDAAAVNRAVKRTLKLAKTDSSGTAVVVGCSMAGLMTLAVLKCSGINNLAAVGEEEYKSLALALGAKAFISAHDSKNMNEVRENLVKCFGAPADAAFTCTTAPIGKSLAQRLVKNSGSVCELAYVLGGGRESSRYYEESLPAGGRFYTPKDYEDAIGFLEAAGKEGLPLYRLITHRYKLEEINEAHWTFLREEGLGIAVFNR